MSTRHNQNLEPPTKKAKLVNENIISVFEHEDDHNKFIEYYESLNSLNLYNISIPSEIWKEIAEYSVGTRSTCKNEECKEEIWRTEGGNKEGYDSYIDQCGNWCCFTCGEWFCPQCKFIYCTHCEDYYCDGCKAESIEECKQCKQITCNACLEVDDHKAFCDNCNVYLCADCKEICKEECDSECCNCGCTEWIYFQMR